MAKFARIKPLQPKKGITTRTYVVHGNVFRVEQGWFTVGDKLAEYIKTVRNDPSNDESPRVFDVVDTMDEVIALDGASKGPPPSPGKTSPASSGPAVDLSDDAPRSASSGVSDMDEPAPDAVPGNGNPALAAAPVRVPGAPGAPKGKRGKLPVSKRSRKARRATTRPATPVSTPGAADVLLSIIQALGGASRPAEPPPKGAGLAVFEAGRLAAFRELAVRLPDALVAMTRARIATGQAVAWTRAERERIIALGMTGDEADTALVVATVAFLSGQIQGLLRLAAPMSALGGQNPDTPAT